jgi:para-nitrobenzyl esterase
MARANATIRAAGVAALLGLQVLAGPAAGQDSLQRETRFGPVVGAADAAGGTVSWKGVPFARPPLGELRWRPPVDPEPWTAPRHATAFAEACVQSGRLYGPGLNNRYDETIGTTLGRTLGSEDCLYLNIWSPAAPASAPRPVIVWVHGGSNITGYTADPVYDGAMLARTADAVVVSVPYRLGIFGFLGVAQLRTGDPAGDSGNFALLDIIQALRFVRADIARFGGDPARVTLMGESAGAVNVYALLTSPLLAGAEPKLFHRLIGLSGGISSVASLPPGSIAPIIPRRIWAARGEALVVQSLIADGTAADEAAARAHLAGRGGAGIAAYLRGKSADDLLTTVLRRLVPRGQGGSNPIPDGHVVPEDPIAAIRAGRYVAVPVLAGNTRDETRLFPSLLALRPDLGGVNGRLLDDAAVFALASRYDPDGPPATRIEDWIHPNYLPVDAPQTGFLARSAELDRVWFAALRDDVLGALRARQPDVWHYRFDWDRLPAPFDVIYGAAHAFDLPFVFGNFGPSLYARISFSRRNEPGRRALSRVMMTSIGAFARSGDPNVEALGRPWKPWPAQIVFDADDTAPRITEREGGK